MLKRIAREGLPWLAARVGLLAASVSLSLWLAGTILQHNEGLLDSLSGALSPSSLVESGLGNQLTPAQQAHASNALTQALGDPTVQAAIGAGQKEADSALESELRSRDPSLARKLAGHPLPLSSLRDAVSGLPARLRNYSHWLALAALVLVGVGFVSSARRERVLRQGARWALTTGGLGLAFGLLLPSVATRLVHEGSLANLAHGLRNGFYASACGLFATLAAVGAIGLVVCALWPQPRVGTAEQ